MSLTRRSSIGHCPPVAVACGLSTPPRQASRQQSFSRRAWFALLVGSVLLLPAAHADKHRHQPKPAVELVAAGKVVGNNAPAEGAVVYLEDPKSLAIKSYLTEANGQFHFSNISPQTDYEVWAEQNGVESKHKFISQFSSHTKFTFTLKLQPKTKRTKRKLLGFL